jgi:hypothetical protein
MPATNRDTAAKVDAIDAEQPTDTNRKPPKPKKKTHAERLAS